MADIDTENTNDTGLIDTEDEAGDTEPRIYELGYHIIPAVSDEEAPREAQAIKEHIEKLGGTAISEEAPQHVTLAYTMVRTENGKREKFDTAHFGSVKFEITPEAVLELKEVLDNNRNILRYIVFKTVRENTRTEVRLPQQSRSERKPEATPRAPLRKAEKDVPVSEEALDRSIEELVVE